MTETGDLIIIDFSWNHWINHLLENVEYCVVEKQRLKESPHFERKFLLRATSSEPNNYILGILHTETYQNLRKNITAGCEVGFTQSLTQTYHQYDIALSIQNLHCLILTLKINVISWLFLHREVVNEHYFNYFVLLMFFH